MAGAADRYQPPASPGKLVRASAPWACSAKVYVPCMGSKSTRCAPGQGGAVLAHNTTLDDLRQCVAADPFVAHEVVSAEIIEIAPNRTDPRPGCMENCAATRWSASWKGMPEFAGADEPASARLRLSPHGTARASGPGREAGDVGRLPRWADLESPCQRMTSKTFFCKPFA
ncbi:hypothetical protein [Streptomyces sp. NPDC051183]|uniref:hypothetical protein n=1 Tax=unclassified Streptomyces TaxID=2593676 RepID=UPI003421B61F